MRPACLEQPGTDWKPNDAASAAVFVQELHLNDRRLKELPRRFEGVGAIYSAEGFSAAFTAALDKLRRGYDPEVKEFEIWFETALILGVLKGIRPDALDSAGKGWNAGVRLDAQRYSLSGSNLRLMTEMIRGMIRKKSGPQWNVRLDRMRDLPNLFSENEPLRSLYAEFHPARCSFESWAFIRLKRWIMGGTDKNF